MTETGTLGDEGAKSGTGTEAVAQPMRLGGAHRVQRVLALR